MFRTLAMLLVIPLSLALIGCKTQTTGFARLDKVADGTTPRKIVCANSPKSGWSQLGYADNGDGVQQIGEDTEETIRGILQNNAGQRRYCPRK